MYKFVVWSVLICLTASSLWFNTDFQSSRLSFVQSDTTISDTTIKDTLKKDSVVVKPLLQLIDTSFAKKDTLKKDTVTAPTIGLMRDTTYKPLVIKTDSALIQSGINIVSLKHVMVCGGVGLAVHFKTYGPFNEKNAFTVQMADEKGKFVAISETSTQSPIKIQTPTNRTGKVFVRIVSSSPVFESDTTFFNISPLPHAKIELADGGFTTKIGPGQVANYRVNLSGAGPWSFQLSDSTTVSNTFITTHTTTIAPKQTKSFKVLDVSNACGSGTTSGEVIVQVSQDTLPNIALRAVPKGGFRVCTGVPLQVNFNATGKYQVGNGFVVQVGDSASQNFVNVSDLAENPIVAKIPFTFRPGKYKLRVSSTFPAHFSDTTDITVSASASTVLQNDTLQIAEGESANLTLNFTGGGPWFVLLNDGTYENDIKTSPHQIKVSPYNPTAYSITSAGGYCGVGDFSGNAFVKVKIPPTTIATGNLVGKTICAGTEIDVPFSTTGRFYAANKFIVQVADTSGKWINLPTTGGMGNLKAKILPPLLTDTLTNQQIRVISTAPNAEGTATTVRVVMPNAAKANITGGGFIRPGGASRLRITFKNGLPPWSFTLTDGTTVSGTFINPYQLTVSPRTTTEYQVQNITNACGVGISAGGVTVKVETN